MNEKPVKKTTPRQFRLPGEILAWLKVKAEENSRTMNGELLAMLKEARKQDEKETAHAQTA